MLIRLYILNYICLFFYGVCPRMHEHMRIYSSQQACTTALLWRTTCRIWLSPSSMLDLEMELRFSGLAECAFVLRFSPRSGLFVPP